MKEITAKDVETKFEKNETLHIIDVREVDEVATGKIPGAIHIRLGLLEFKLPDLDKNNEYIMVCRSGGRSGQATQFLESQGFQAVNMIGGMMAWEGEIE